MTYSPTPRYRDVFQSTPGGGFVEKVKGFLRGVGFKLNSGIKSSQPTALKIKESDNAPCDPETVPGGVVSYNVSLTSYYDRRAAANLRAPGPRRYSTQEVAAARAATPYHPGTLTGIGQIINVNTERLARADFEVTELKDISDINLYTSKTKQPLAVKEPGNRRFQFEQGER